MKLALITLSAIIGIVLVCTFMVYGAKNGAISLEESVNAAKSGIDVQLVNRFNKLTELAECVKRYDERTTPSSASPRSTRSPSSTQSSGHRRTTDS